MCWKLCKNGHSWYNKFFCNSCKNGRYSTIDLSWLRGTTKINAETSKDIQCAAIEEWKNESETFATVSEACHVRNALRATMSIDSRTLTNWQTRTPINTFVTGNQTVSFLLDFRSIVGLPKISIDMAIKVRKGLLIWLIVYY